MRRFPGITRMIIRSLVGKPSTLMHPFMERTYPAAARGRVEVDIGACIFCRLCERNCPTKALAVSKENKEWQIDALKCCTCSRCVEVCPKQCLTMEPSYHPPVRSRVEGMHTTVLPPDRRNEEEARADSL